MYIKSYELFEASIINIFRSEDGIRIASNIEDLLLDLEDQGFRIKIDILSTRIEIMISLFKIETVKVINYFNNIKDDLHRVFDYMETEGYEVDKSSYEKTVLNKHSRLLIIIFNKK